MKSAVLCNGPKTKNKYQGRNDYDYVIGCNIPWTECDSTVIIDSAVIEKWYKQQEIVTVPVHFSENSWNRAKALDQQFFMKYFIEVLEVQQNQHSSGHNACEILIRKGSTSIDIYGCDSWWENSDASYTNNFVPRSVGPNSEVRIVTKIKGWKQRWNIMIDNNPKILFNFIQ